ncbi:DUF2103 domain-containing protein [Halobium salinum]|uniref:DUF2103 domain-containing protein n=1 Tax=Halobium salinum TaxID=1364940 RepID=A0ABD5PD64_9EURY|nr:DUF2103 domain-containing protein [Halobium salinum]
MDCRRCGTPLEKPGDYCLTCETGNCDAVVVVFEADRATLTLLRDEEGSAPNDEVDTVVVGETTVTTVPESGGEAGVVELRNFAGRVADELRRKRPEAVYAAAVDADALAPTGGGSTDLRTPQDALRETRAQVRYEFRRVAGDDPVAAVLDRRGQRSLEVVETPPREKLGGTHSTLIGDRDGLRAIGVVADHPHVKKVVPGPIDAGGKGSRTGLRAKVTRADGNGNVRLLLRDGSSVQENRVVTTAFDRETGEWVREDLNEALDEAEFQ